MVKLFNIRRDDLFIYADYRPVGYGDVIGSVTVRLSDGERTEWVQPDGPGGHPWYAYLAVKRLNQIMNMPVLPERTSIECY